MRQIILDKPTILVSVGGGRFGHDLLECVARAAPILKEKIPHHIQVFTGAFSPKEVLILLQDLTKDLDNITCDRYTTHLLDYMQQADLSIGMGGYNTTMNILSTGIKAMMMAFQGNNDKEQETRLQKLDSLRRVKMIQPEDLRPEKFAGQIINYLEQTPSKLTLNLDGVANTAKYLNQLAFESQQSSRQLINF
jgi:predicted glycosyltransferase